MNTNSGGTSQQGVEASPAPLIAKDTAHTNTLTCYITLMDTTKTDKATHTNAIATLNTRQLQIFAGINDISKNLTNSLASSFNNKSEIDTFYSNKCGYSPLLSDSC